MTERDERQKRLRTSASLMSDPYAVMRYQETAADITAELEASQRDREALTELMAYVDEALTAAQAGGRITGEPLADYIKRMIEETKEGT